MTNANNPTVADVRISVITPTQGRPSLTQTARSILPQLRVDDEWIIVADNHDGTVTIPIGEWFEGARTIFGGVLSSKYTHDTLAFDPIDGVTKQSANGSGMSFVRAGAKVVIAQHDAGHHCYGHCQINAAIDAVRDTDPNRVIVFVDDDDVLLANALAHVRSAFMLYGPNTIALFRFVTPWRQVLPQGMMLYQGGIGGHSLVAPARLMGDWTCRYEGDFDAIQSTIRGNEALVRWMPHTIALTRPTDADKGVYQWHA